MTRESPKFKAQKLEQYLAQQPLDTFIDSEGMKSAANIHSRNELNGYVYTHRESHKNEPVKLMNIHGVGYFLSDFALLDTETSSLYIHELFRGLVGLSDEEVWQSYQDNYTRWGSYNWTSMDGGAITLLSDLLHRVKLAESDYSAGTLITTGAVRNIVEIIMSGGYKEFAQYDGSQMNVLRVSIREFNKMMGVFGLACVSMTDEYEKVIGRQPSWSVYGLKQT